MPPPPPLPLGPIHTGALDSELQIAIDAVRPPSYPPQPSGRGTRRGSMMMGSRIHIGSGEDLALSRVMKPSGFARASMSSMVASGGKLSVSAQLEERVRRMSIAPGSAGDNPRNRSIPASPVLPDPHRLANRRKSYIARRPSMAAPRTGPVAPVMSPTTKAAPHLVQQQQQLQPPIVFVRGRGGSATARDLCVPVAAGMNSNGVSAAARPRTAEQQQGNLSTKSVMYSYSWSPSDSPEPLDDASRTYPHPHLPPSSTLVLPAVQEYARVLPATVKSPKARSSHHHQGVRSLLTSTFGIRADGMGSFGEDDEYDDLYADDDEDGDLTSAVPPAAPATTATAPPPKPLLAVVPAAAMTRAYRSRRRFTVVFHRRRHGGGTGSHSHSRSTSRAASRAASRGNVGDDSSASSSRPGSGKSTSSTGGDNTNGPLADTDSAEPRISSARAAALRLAASAAAMRAKPARMPRSNIRGLTVGRPVTINALHDIAEKLLLYKKRANYMLWRGSKSARQRRATEAKRKKVEGMRIEIITKMRQLEDWHLRFEKLNLTRRRLREDHKKLHDTINGRMTGILGEISSTDETLATLATDHAAHTQESHVSLSSLQHASQRRLRQLEREVAVKRQDLAELDRAIADLYALRAALQADPRVFDREAEPLRRDLRAAVERAERDRDDASVLLDHSGVEANSRLLQEVKGWLVHDPELGTYFGGTNVPLHEARARMAAERARQLAAQKGLAQEIETLRVNREALTRTKRELERPERERKRERQVRHARAPLLLDPSLVDVK